MSQASHPTADFAELSDEALFAQYIEGNVAAFAALLGRYEQPVFRYVYRHLNDHQRAEDVYQEVFVRVVRSAAKFQPGTTFAAWLYRIARNLCIDTIRRDGLRKAVSLDHTDGGANGRMGGESLGQSIAGTDPAPDARIIGDEQAERVRDAIAKLPDELRELVLLKESAGLTFREIADITGTPESTLKSRMRAALDALREILSKGRLSIQ